MATSGTYNKEKELSTNLDEGIITSSDEPILISDIFPLADKDLVNREVLKRLIAILEEKSVGEIVNNGEEVIIKDLAGNAKMTLKVHKKVSYRNRKPNMPMYGEGVLKDADCALFSTDTLGNRYLVMPITRVENVYGVGRSLLSPYIEGDIVKVESNKSVELRCIQSGITSNSEINAYGKKFGDTIEDGTVVWEVIEKVMSVDENFADSGNITLETLSQGLIDQIVEGVFNPDALLEVHGLMTSEGEELVTTEEEPLLAQVDYNNF